MARRGRRFGAPDGVVSHERDSFVLRCSSWALAAPAGSTGETKHCAPSGDRAACGRRGMPLARARGTGQVGGGKVACRCMPDPTRYEQVRSFRYAPRQARGPATSYHSRAPTGAQRMALSTTACKSHATTAQPSSCTRRPRVGHVRTRPRNTALANTHQDTRTTKSVHTSTHPQGNPPPTAQRTRASYRLALLASTAAWTTTHCCAARLRSRPRERGLPCAGARLSSSMHLRSC